MELDKQELELIQNNLSWNECPDINNQLLDLNNKLTRMIAEYCDHDWRNTYRESEVIECTKCGEEHC